MFKIIGELASTFFNLSSLTLKVLAGAWLLALILCLAGITFYAVEAHLEYERSAAVAQAKNAATAELAAKLNAAAAADLKAQQAQQAASMEALSQRKAKDDQAWAGMNTQIEEIHDDVTPAPVANPAPAVEPYEGPHVLDDKPAPAPEPVLADDDSPYDGPHILNDIPVRLKSRPHDVAATTSAPARARTQRPVAPRVAGPAAPRLPVLPAASSGFADFVRADADADRMLQRATADAWGNGSSVAGGGHR